MPVVNTDYWKASKQEVPSKKSQLNGYLYPTPTMMIDISTATTNNNSQQRGWMGGILCAQILQNENRVIVFWRRHDLRVLPTCLEPRYEVTLAGRSSLHQRSLGQVV